MCCMYLCQRTYIYIHIRIMYIYIYCIFAYCISPCMYILRHRSKCIPNGKWTVGNWTLELSQTTIWLSGGQEGVKELWVSIHFMEKGTKEIVRVSRPHCLTIQINLSQPPLQFTESNLPWLLKKHGVYFADMKAIQAFIGYHEIMLAYISLTLW